MNITLFGQRDKVWHMAAGALVALVVTLALQLPAPLCQAVLGAFAVMLGSASAPGVGFVAAVLAGLLKEAHDWLVNTYLRLRQRPPRHTVDPLDALATALGGLLTVLPITMVMS